MPTVYFASLVLEEVSDRRRSRPCGGGPCLQRVPRDRCIPSIGGAAVRLTIPLLIASALETRSGGRSPVTRWVQFSLIGIASIWSIEVFAYTLATFAGVVAVEAATLPRQERLHWLGRLIAFAVASCAIVHIGFAALTLAASGSLPDWSQYVVFARSFLFGSVGSINFDIPPWSPGLAVGVFYAASAATLVLLVLRRADLLERRRPMLVVLSGTTAYGIATYSYYVDRSVFVVLPRVCLPAVILGALWLALILSPESGASRWERLGGLAVGLSAWVLLLSVSWSWVYTRFPDSALAHLVPGGPSLPFALHRLWHLPPLDPRAPRLVRMMERDMPAERRSLVLVSSNLNTEILLRSGRANKLPIGDPAEGQLRRARPSAVNSTCGGPTETW